MEIQGAEVSSGNNPVDDKRDTSMEPKRTSHSQLPTSPTSWTSIGSGMFSVDDDENDESDRDKDSTIVWKSPPSSQAQSPSAIVDKAPSGANCTTQSLESGHNNAHMDHDYEYEYAGHKNDDQERRTATAAVATVDPTTTLDTSSSRPTIDLANPPPFSQSLNDVQNPTTAADVDAATGTTATSAQSPSSNEIKESETSQPPSPSSTFSCLLPLALCVLAVTLSMVGSWDCHYFHGANISFTGGRFGLWTLEDTTGRCQLWDVLFFSFALDKRLHTARFASMVVQLCGLAITAGLTQALQYHATSILIGSILALAFVLSVLLTSGLYNLWMFFFLFSYIVFILIVRFLFIHPVRRRISNRGVKILAGHCGLCAFGSWATLIVLFSNFCQCSSLSSDALAGRAHDAVQCQNDEGTCTLGYAGGVFVAAGFVWALTAVVIWKHGILQPEAPAAPTISVEPQAVNEMGDAAAAVDPAIDASAMSQSRGRLLSAESVGDQSDGGTCRILFDHYPRHSITTRAMLAGEQLLETTSQTMGRHGNYLQTAIQGARVLLTQRAFVVPLFYHRPASTRQTGPQHDNRRECARSSNVDCERDNGLSLSPNITAVASSITTATAASETLVKTSSLPEHSDNDPENADSATLSPTRPDTRSSCQKTCCDYRVVERTRLEQVVFWSFRVALGVLIFFYVLIVTLMVGSYAENATAAKSPDTSYNFITDVVCAYNADDPTQPFETYLTKNDAVLANRTVAHCGACGDCSNPFDIFTYVETRKSVAKLAKQCGVVAVLGTEEELTNCLQGKIGFSRRCTECWTDNMINTAEYCLFTCMKTTLTGLAATNNIAGLGDTVWLNQCIYCDEKLSGPQFVQCSGVARRRLGIRSEIERDPDEQCTNMDVDWVNVNWTQTFPQLEAPTSSPPPAGKGR